MQMRVFTVVMTHYKHLRIIISHTSKIFGSNIRHFRIGQFRSVLHREIERYMGDGLGNRAERCLHPKTFGNGVDAFHPQPLCSKKFGIPLSEDITYGTAKVRSLNYFSNHPL